VGAAAAGLQAALVVRRHDLAAPDAPISTFDSLHEVLDSLQDRLDK
jgi:hypothetical protein